MPFPVKLAFGFWLNAYLKLSFLAKSALALVCCYFLKKNKSSRLQMIPTQHVAIFSPLILCHS